MTAALREVAEAYPRDTLATFLTNHDQNRVIGQLGDDPAAARLAATLLLTGPGAPFIYYGEEIGMSGRKPDERIRTPMRWDATEPAAGFSTAAPWEALSDDPASEVNVADESADPDSLLATYRDLIRLRASQPALASATSSRSTRRTAASSRSFATAGTDAVLVVANVGNEAVSSPILSLDEGPLCGTPTAPSSLRGDGQVAAPAITPSGGFEDYAPVATLGPREAIVIEPSPVTRRGRA